MHRKAKTAKERSYSGTKATTDTVAKNLNLKPDDVAVAAYFKAEKRQFEPGHELDDWFDAEQELSGG